LVCSSGVGLTSSGGVTLGVGDLAGSSAPQGITIQAGKSSVGAGELSISSGDASTGSVGAVSIKVGKGNYASSTTAGTATITAADGVFNGGSTALNAGSAPGTGGSINVKPGSGGAEAGSVDGNVEFYSAPAGSTPNVKVAGSGKVTIASANSKDVGVASGGSMTFGTSGGSSEVRFSPPTPAGEPTLTPLFRATADRIFSHVPFQSPKFASPSDRRIKTQIEDVDDHAILMRLQGLEIKEYHFSSDWQKVRGIGDIAVRGIIAHRPERHSPST